jgi:hypothetical protein
MGSVRLAQFSNSQGENSPVHSESSDVLIPEEPPVVCSCVESMYLESLPCADNVEVTMHDSPSITSCTMGSFISSRYFSADVVLRTLYSRSSTVCSSANSLGFSPAHIGSPGSCNPFMADTYGYSPRTIRSTALQPCAYAYYAQGISSSLLKHSKKLDPTLNTIGIGSDLRNWIPDTGASSHFTPCLSDMKEVEEVLDLGLEVADGHIVQCTARGIVEMNMIADDGLTLKASLHGVICVPGLKRHLFSVTAFASRGHYAIVRKNEIQLMFGNEGRPLTLMLKNGMPAANNATLRQSVSIPENEQQKSHKKKIDLELAHARFIRPSRALLAASSAEVWNDLSIRMSPDYDCINCRIFAMKATARIKHPSTPVSKPVQVIHVNILPAVSDDSLTPKSYFLALLILVDAFSRFTRVIGMSNKSTKSVTAALSFFAAEHRLISGVKLWKIEKIKGDAGS